MYQPYVDSDIQEIIDRLGDDVQAFSGKSVILTGGRGFLGRYFTEVFAQLNQRVLETPARVIVLDNLLTSGKMGSKSVDIEHIDFIRHDVTEPFDYEGSLDYVIHAAGIASPYYYRAYQLETLDVAINGTRNMLELATDLQARFTFFSSSEIYGDPDSQQVPTTEAYRGNVSCQGPRACYDESKRLGETLCYIFSEKYGTITNAIRPFNVYGPGMQENDYRVLPNFASRIKSGIPLNIYGDGNQTRTFCYVTDALVGFFRVILCGEPGEPYNIGRPDPEISMLELVQRIEKVLGKEVAYNIVKHPDSYPADEPNRRCPDISRARKHLGFQPMVDLDEGLRRFFEWANEAYSGA